MALLGSLQTSRRLHWGAPRRVPDLLGLAGVVQKEEDISVLADAVVGEALQVDEEVMRHGDTATVTVTLSRAVALRIRTTVSARRTATLHV